MITTVFLSSSQISVLARLAGWQPFPWSPLLSHLGVDEPSDDEIQALAAKQLIVDDGAPRANHALELALAAVSEPDVLVEIALPDHPAVALCSAGPLTVGWHEYDRGGVALSFPLAVSDRYHVISDLLRADDGVDEAPGRRIEVSPFELELITLAAEPQDGGGLATPEALLGRLDAAGWVTDLRTTSRWLDRLVDGGLLRRTGAGVEPAGDALMFAGSLEYGFAVRKVTTANDPTAPPIADGLHVYRAGERLVATRARGGDGDATIECMELNRRQLADVIFTLTLDPDELGAVGSV